jgi:glycosyltransferase 2 family protein
LKKARFWIGILISLVALVLAFRRVDLGSVWSALGEVNYWFLAASLVPLLLFLFLRAVRWRLLFYPLTGLRVGNLFAVINIGYLFSNVFPARLGDVARAYLIGDTEEVSRTTALSTILAERVLDALSAVGGFFLVMLLVSTGRSSSAPLPDWMVRSGLIIGAAALVAVIAFVALVRRRTWTLALLRRILEFLHWPEPEKVKRTGQRVAAKTRLRFLDNLPWPGRERLLQVSDSLIDGLAGITTLRLGPPLLFWSALIWAVISSFYWLVLLAFDPGQPFVAGLAVASITALGMTVPSSPGYIGVFELLSRETMVLFGMAPERALSYGLVAHAVVYVVYSLLGLLGMAQQNLSYAQIQKRIASEAQKLP